MELLLDVAEAGFHILLVESGCARAERHILLGGQRVKLRELFRIAFAGDRDFSESEPCSFIDDERDAIRRHDLRRDLHIVVAVVAEDFREQESGVSGAPWTGGFFADIDQPVAHELKDFAFALAGHAPDLDARFRQRDTGKGECADEGKDGERKFHRNLILHIAITRWSPSAARPAVTYNFSLNFKVAEL